MEYCCGPTSRLGGPKYFDAGCITVRLTMNTDMRTSEGLQYALDNVNRAAADGLYIALWGSLPYTAGIPWFRLNRRFAKARAKNEAHRADFQKLITNFRIVADR
eukprot:7364878-Heterocapsa_arctica.AAC.1